MRGHDIAATAIRGRRVEYGILSDGERRTLDAVARAVAGEGTRASVEELLSKVSPTDVSGLRLALAALERGSGAFGVRRRFSALESGDAAELLGRMARGPGPVREAATALRALGLLAFYGSPDGWAVTGYDGPWLGRRTVDVEPAPTLDVESAWDLAGSVVRTQACVIGSGAGGAAAAAGLAARGVDVVVLEAGYPFTAADADQRVLSMMPRLYQDAGLRATADRSIGILQGRGLGGSTLHNTGLVCETPAGILERWRAHGFPWTDAEWRPAVRAVIGTLRATRVPDEAVTGTNALLRAGASTLGWRHDVALHNRSVCSGCGYCMLGCAYNRKWNAALTYLPEASAHGARIVAGASAVVVEARGAGWRVLATADDRSVFAVECDVVLVAAGALDTPALLRRSALGNRNVGRGLRLHPTPLVYASFEDDVVPWRGVPQSILVTERATFLRDGHGGSILLASAATQPALAAVGMPGHGSAHRERMARLRRTAIAGALLHDEGAGRVGLTRSGRPRAFYRLHDIDRQEASASVAALAELFFAAGASQVTLPFADAPDARDMDDVHGALAGADWRPHRVLLNAVHPQGTCATGSPREGATDAYGEVYGAPGVFVCDASLFPTSVGVPPQVTIMAQASLVAGRVAEEFRA